MADTAARADALWRAITYLAVAQLHLTGNPLLLRRLQDGDMKAHPSGHWGTVPGIAWVLAHLGLVAGHYPSVDIVPVIGPGHAGVAQLALAWLTGDLAKVRPQFTRDLAGLEALVAAFPEVDGLGSEVHPSLPAGHHVGGWLGGAMAFAQGAAVDAPDRLMVPILGDGECETPTTAAAWLAHGTLGGPLVLPVIHLNGHRMGSASILGRMSDDDLRRWASGLGWEPVIVHVADGTPAEHARSQEVVDSCVREVLRGERRMIVVRCVKGWSGPIAAHKTPLTDLAADSHQRVLLRRWLVSYRPGELFDGMGQPAGALAEAVGVVRFGDLPAAKPASAYVDRGADSGFPAQIGEVLRAYAQAGDFKVFSPDELRSNRLGELSAESWVHEVLAEEVLLGWLAGWTASGRRGVLISYEAFAPLMLTGLVGLLKQRRLAGSTLPSINLLLTSYGWHNAYTHGDPSLSTALIATGDPAVRVYTPADPRRAAVALDDALRSAGRVNLIIAGKHTTAKHPTSTLSDEQLTGLAVWPHLSDHTDPDLTLICAGDLPAALAGEAAAQIRARHGCSVRVIGVHELTSLAAPDVDVYLGENAAVLIATLGHPAAVWGLLAGRLNRPAEVIGWREPPYPMAQAALATQAGMDVAGLVTAAGNLLRDRAVRRWPR